MDFIKEITNAEPVPKQMVTHLQVACELLMGAINGTVHVVRDNLQAKMGIMSK